MPVRLIRNQPIRENGRTITLGTEAGPEAADPRRVVSVSPRSATGETEPDAPSKTPDRQPSDDLAGTVGGLLEASGGAIRQLRELLNQVAQTESRAATASLHLQERLRLSARMLKAFQSQIARVGSGLADLEARQSASDEAARRFQEQVNALEERVTQCVQNAGARIDHLSEAASGDLEAKLTRQQERIDDVCRKVTEATARAETMLQSITATEQRITAAVGEAASSTDALESAATASRDLLEESAAAQTELNAKLLQAGREHEKLQTRQRSVHVDVSEALERCTTAAKGLERTVHEAKAVQGQIKHARDAGRRLEGLLDRLAPWRQLVAQGEDSPDALPPSVGAVLDQIEARVREDLGGWSSVMRQLADRIDRLVPRAGAGAPGDQETPPTGSGVVTTVTRPVALPGPAARPQAQGRPGDA